MSLKALESLNSGGAQTGAQGQLILPAASKMQDPKLKAL